MAKKTKSKGGPRSAGNGKPKPPVTVAVGVPRTLDARPDGPDFRDKLYEATLVEVPPFRTLEEYISEYPADGKLNILDQGQEGACTGFGLAAVANYLLQTRVVKPDAKPVSPRMFYEMARRYDEWPGEDYSGSSARGAMKGWHKHGVCGEADWPYRADKLGTLDDARSRDAVTRPLGAYYRVNHQDLICVHSALSEVGILYATAQVHAGWQSVGADGRIKRQDQIIGGHAFAIVGYDLDGLWVQNSWGPDWGYGGFCHITYDDWLANGTDAWVARLGAPVRFGSPETTARANAYIAGLGDGYTFAALRPHIVSLKNNGQLSDTGTYAKTEAEVRALFTDDFPRITADWKAKRILLYAHGGLTDEASAVQHVADTRQALIDAEVFPLAFIWHTDYWTTLKNILSDALSRRRSEGFLDTTKNFMLDRLDDTLEPVARLLSGKAEWDEMKENGERATTTTKGGARLVAQCLAELLAQDPSVELHVAGHSAGSQFHGPLVQLLGSPKKKIPAGPMQGETGLGLPIATCTLWAPACTVDFFEQTYAPIVEGGGIGKFSVFTLTDRAEQDDNCAKIYNKSLLYLVSNAFEDKPRIPLFRDGWPILGMEKFIRADGGKLLAWFKQNKVNWVLSPNAEPDGSPQASRSTSHGGFDDDTATLKATLALITGMSKQSAARAKLVIRPSARALRQKRFDLG